MVLSTKLVALFGLIGAGEAAYKLVDNFNKENFFSGFEFQAIDDPTKGFVKYVNGQTANKDQLAGFAEDEIFLGVKNVDQAPGGRMSVRVQSKKDYTRGLFISDITHMPVGCGTWPALWTTSVSDWPMKGEIDIIEGVNTQTTNAVTLHTSPGCVMDNKGSVYEGRKALKQTDCSAPQGKGYEGCGQATDDPNNYGVGFNQKGGGIYALEWTSDRIAVWFFVRGSPEEQKLSAGGNAAPNPAEWGKPMANFAKSPSCDIGARFQNHKIIINTTLCGEWAGNVWDTYPECKALNMTCVDYVQKVPDAFTNAYWTIRSIKVYQQS